ncbi:MAG TPA: hypothetical protein VKQ73_01920 [Stellaceae bacterium]|nr:hypothetical protein [Stellaceae bacterium]
MGRSRFFPTSLERAAFQPPASYERGSWQPGKTGALALELALLISAIAVLAVNVVR